MKAVSLPTLLYIIGLYAEKGKGGGFTFASIVLYPSLVTSKILLYVRITIGVSIS